MNLIFSETNPEAIQIEKSNLVAGLQTYSIVSRVNNQPKKGDSVVPKEDGTKYFTCSDTTK